MGFSLKLLICSFLPKVISGRTGRHPWHPEAEIWSCLWSFISELSCIVIHCAIPFWAVTLRALAHPSIFSPRKDSLEVLGSIVGHPMWSSRFCVDLDLKFHFTNIGMTSACNTIYNSLAPFWMLNSGHEEDMYLLLVIFAQRRFLWNWHFYCELMFLSTSNKPMFWTANAILHVA